MASLKRVLQSSTHCSSARRLALAALLLIGAADLGRALADRPVPPAASVPSPTGAPKEWSGESGASGHPLMQAAAIRHAAANFESCLDQLWQQAARRNVSRASFDKHVRGLTPDLRIMDLLDAQP
jgi:membrane-bound lytic murein transglycosylase B